MTYERRDDVSPVPAWLDPLPAAGPVEASGRSSDREAHLRRVRCVERRLRGLEGIIDGDAGPLLVLTQVAAVSRALHSVAVGLLDEHFRSWIAIAMDEHDPRATDMIDDATRAIESLLRP